jgi:hypothetical protein
MTKIVNRVKALHAARSGQLPDLGSCALGDGRGANGARIAIGLNRPRATATLPDEMHAIRSVFPESLDHGRFTLHCDRYG